MLVGGRAKGRGEAKGESEGDIAYDIHFLHALCIFGSALLLLEFLSNGPLLQIRLSIRS